MQQEVSDDSTNNWSIVASDKFIHATRDSGYKSTSSAISELVDNALQAGASKVEITVKKPSGSNEVEVIVSDNGCGMDLFTLRQALRFGGSSRFNDRSGLGRFGMGLPNSSLSQAKRVTVTSWTRRKTKASSRQNVFGSGAPLQSYLDVDEIASGRITEVPRPRNPCKHPLSRPTRSGTVVHWEQCDRLDHKRPITICRHLAAELSRRFRYFLTKGKRIVINGTAIEPVDPMYLTGSTSRQKAKLYGREIRYAVSTNPLDPDAPVGFVCVRFSELPVRKWALLSNEEKRELGIIGNAGVSIMRANREVDSGWFFFGDKRKENYDDWWRCEITYDPILDEAFGLTHTKQQIKPQQYLFDILSPDLESMARTLNTRARNAHLGLRDSSVKKRSEIIASVRSRHLEPVSDILAPMRDSRIQYEIREAPLKDGAFYSFESERGTIVLTLDPDHSFFRELYKPLRQSKELASIQMLIELVFIAAVRAEATMSSSDNDVLQSFRIKWGCTAETLLAGCRTFH